MSSIFSSSACNVITHRGVLCGRRSVQVHPSLGHICALHLHHTRRSLRARSNLQVRVDQDDLAALDNLAKLYNLSKSDAFRRVLKHLPMPRSLTDAITYRELRKIGVNLNQVAKALNSGEDPNNASILQVLMDLDAHLEEVELHLMGTPLEEP